MGILTETVEVAKWIPILALAYIFFLKGFLIYVVYLRYREHLEMTTKPDTSNPPANDKKDYNGLTLLKLLRGVGE